MKVTIRSATAADVPSLGILRGQAIENACSDVYERSAYAELVANPTDDLETWIERDGTTVLVAETEITPVAYGALEDGSGRLRSIATNPDYQREGFGSVLVDRLEQRADEQDCEELTVTAPGVAVDFFEAVGFERVGDDEWYGLPGARLRKPVDP